MVRGRTWGRLVLYPLLYNGMGAPLVPLGTLCRNVAAKEASQYHPQPTTPLNETPDASPAIHPLPPSHSVHPNAVHCSSSLPSSQMTSDSLALEPVVPGIAQTLSTSEETTDLPRYRWWPDSLALLLIVPGVSQSLEKQDNPSAPTGPSTTHPPHPRMHDKLFFLLSLHPGQVQ